MMLIGHDAYSKMKMMKPIRNYVRNVLQKFLTHKKKIYKTTTKGANMMMSILLSTTGTITLFFVDRIRHVHKPLCTYIAAFLLCLAACLAVDCFADETLEREIEQDLLAVYYSIEDDEAEYEVPYCLQALTSNEERLYWNGWQSCCNEGYKRIEDARQISLFIPNIERREKVKTAIAIAVNSLFASGLKAKVVIALAETLIVYLNGCWEQWDKIKPHLDEAEYYFKSADIYWKKLHPNAK